MFQVERPLCSSSPIPLQQSCEPKFKDLAPCAPLWRCFSSSRDSFHYVTIEHPWTISFFYIGWIVICWLCGRWWNAPLEFVSAWVTERPLSLTLLKRSWGKEPGILQNNVLYETFNQIDTFATYLQYLFRPDLGYIQPILTHLHHPPFHFRSW